VMLLLGFTENLTLRMLHVWDSNPIIYRAFPEPRTAMVHVISSIERTGSLRSFSLKLLPIYFHFSSLTPRTNLLPLPLNPHRLFIMRRHHMHQPDRNLRDVIRHTRLQLRQAIAPVAADCIAAGRRAVRVRVHVPVEGAGAIEEKPVEVQH
jgi:hypothetical protein